ncbi:MAG TPA: PLP-dependent aminotransferase family protein [Kiloniellales bacterium]
MTKWSPPLEELSGPRYLAIADALAADIANGRLKPGTRLPTHRDLAWDLKVTVGTVSRAYAEAERRGLIYGEVGRGTYVRERTPVTLPAESAAGRNFVDMAYNFPPLTEALSVLSDTLAEVARDQDLADLMGYRLDPGRRRHRAAVAAWMSEFGVPAEAEDVVLTYGAQNAMLLAAMALAGPDSTILTEELTYYGIKTIAAQLNIRVHGVAMDDQGLMPDALEAACRTSGAKLLYCIPTLQNPTTSIMPEARRREIVAIAARHDVTIVEDDVYGFLPEDAPPPLAALAPERTVYIASLSKFVGPGLRLGFLRAAPEAVRAIATALRASSLIAPAFLAEVGARLIERGEARRLALWQRGEARRRQRMAARILAGQQVTTHPEAFHLWLELPEPWRREIFSAEARHRGVGVGSAEVFAVGRGPVPHAVRLCLQASASAAEVERGLEILAGMLAERPSSGLALV